jgi:nucleotide-binding universal stress UspA family protein
MFPIHTILFPTDMSSYAQAAFPFACALAHDCGARLIVLHVMPPPLYQEQIEARYHPEEYYAGPEDALRSIHAPAENVRVEHVLKEGNATKLIVEAAEEFKAGLIVIATHGRSGLRHLLFGSVAEKVLLQAPCPVLCIKTPFPEAKEMSPKEEPVKATAPAPKKLPPLALKTIVCPVDFSACSDNAFQLACNLAKEQGARVIVVHVTSVPDLAYTGYGIPAGNLAREDYLAEARQNLGKIHAPDKGLALERRLEDGDPGGEVVRVATETGADLIVMGTHGHKGVAHVLMGSVADKVVRKAPCPVLTLKASATAPA